MFRSFLFVPGDRPERFDKATASGADAVCIDLEDAVSAANKPTARRATLEYLGRGAPRPCAIGLRINGLDCLDGYRDLVALAESRAMADFVLLPKVKSGDAVEQVRTLFSDSAPPIWALMETPEALAAIEDLVKSVGDRGGVVFGGADFSASIGSDMSWDALYFARAAIIAAAALAGCQTLDVPYLNVRDLEGLIAETRRSKAVGFSGRSCIHPDQVGPINDIYTPTTAEVASARAVINAYENNQGRVLLHEGRLVEKPVLAAAKRVIARAR